ncbi:berbamunine synthase [Aspergillus awamori]|uniref:Berbamunine synthase n=1 Tax=Aspergillus awamori TaxID=105351 RepID=A0A401KL39_ASPAW|nr:berbamunine synthase [Aspergillus awamori]GKZ57406.1 hypothetical protein AnigIFM49718_002716 [Aspergillus niger]
MFNAVSYALTQGLYFIAFVFLVQCLRLLWKRPFPANAPTFVPGYPVVGALQFFHDRKRFCDSSRAASSTGSYSYYLGQHRVVGLCGPQGRKTFFEGEYLDVDQGVSLLIPFANAVEKPTDPSIETHASYVRATIRRRLLRTQSLEFVPLAIEPCTTATLDRIATKGLIDPFSEIAWFYAQSTMAVIGVSKVARSPELSRRVSKLTSLMSGTFSAADIVVPWLLNPLHIPKLVAIGWLYVMLWQGIRNQKREEQQESLHKQDPKKVGMLQDMVMKGRGTRALLQTLMTTTFAAQGNSPTVASWILIMLAAYPHWMIRVRQEMDQVVAKHRKHSEPADQVLRALNVSTWEHEFPLLHACLLETVRLVVVLVLIRKNISPTDIPIGDTGEVIPPGAYVTYDAQEVTRDPGIYTDPERWDPGRFLSDRAEHLKGVLAFTGFGGGRKKCREWSCLF